jgi:GNAT superfamily N-acetyltransferase
MLHIRKLSLFQAEPLATLARQIFLDTFLPVNNPVDVIDYADRYLNSQTFEKELADPLYFTYGVLLESQLIGYIQMLINRQETYEGIELELKRFYLLKDHHGKGFADQMMAVCEAQARELNYKSFWLGVWEKNFKAQKFYQKQGFKKIAAHPFVMGQETQTDFIFAKELN